MLKFLLFLPLITSDYLTTPDPDFSFLNTEQIEAYSHTWFLIANQLTHNCLEVRCNNKKCKTYQAECTGKKNQQWKLDRFPDNSFALRSSFNGHVLDVAGASKLNRGEIVIFNYLNQTNQRWDVEQLDESFYAIRALHSAKCLHVEEEDVFQMDCMQEGEQRFVFQMILEEN